MKRFDPRTRLALGIMAIAAVLIGQRPVTLMGLCALLLAALPCLRLGGAWVRSLRLVLPMVGLVFVIGLLSFDLRAAVLLSVRLLDLLVVSFVFFRTVSPEEMGDALRKIGMPYEFAFILTTAMRYVPLIGQKIRQIFEAQLSRGIDLRPRLRNAKNFMALLMPLLAQSFFLSEELAMAMESRGFGRKERTFRRSYRLHSWEYGVIFVSLFALLAFACWERGWGP